MSDERLYPGIEVHQANTAGRRPDTFLLTPEGWVVEIGRAAHTVLLEVVNSPEWEIGQRHMLSRASVKDDAEEMLCITQVLRQTPAGYGVRFITGTGGLVLLAGTLSAVAEENGVGNDGSGLIEWFEKLADGNRLAFGSWSMFWNRVTMTAHAATEGSVSHDHYSKVVRSASTYRKPGQKIKRNSRCPCGSRRKWKKCCGRRAP